MTDELQKHGALPGTQAGEEQRQPEPGETGGRVTPPPGQSGPGVLELIYGVLFDPVRTFKKVAANPPLLQAVLIYALIGFAGLIMGVFVNLDYLPRSIPELPLPVLQLLQKMAPFIALVGFVIQFIKWFAYSALLHLIADLYGGRGRARGVFTVYGLAALPTIFLLPVQLLQIVLGQSFLLGILVLLVSIALGIWGVVLLVLGVREVHQFTTSMALAVVFTPVLVILTLIFLAVLAVMASAASLPPLVQML